MDVKVEDLLISDKEYKKAVNDAKRLWKADKREIINTDELSREEAQAIAEDSKIILLAYQRRQTEKALIKAVDLKLQELRSPPEKAPEEGMEEVPEEEAGEALE